MLAINYKSLFARPDKNLNIKLAINLKSLIALLAPGNKIYPYFFYILLSKQNATKKEQMYLE